MLFVFAALRRRLNMLFLLVFGVSRGYPVSQQFVPTVGFVLLACLPIVSRGTGLIPLSCSYKVSTPPLIQIYIILAISLALVFLAVVTVTVFKTKIGRQL